MMRSGEECLELCDRVARKPRVNGLFFPTELRLKLTALFPLVERSVLRPSVAHQPRNIWGDCTKRKKLYAKRPPSSRKGPFRVLTLGSFILVSLDDVVAFAAFVTTFRSPKAGVTRLGYC